MRLHCRRASMLPCPALIPCHPPLLVAIQSRGAPNTSHTKVSIVIAPTHNEPHARCLPIISPLPAGVCPRSGLAGFTTLPVPDGSISFICARRRGLCGLGGHGAPDEPEPAERQHGLRRRLLRHSAHHLPQDSESEKLPRPHRRLPRRSNSPGAPVPPALAGTSPMVIVSHCWSPYWILGQSIVFVIGWLGGIYIINTPERWGD